MIQSPPNLPGWDDVPAVDILGGRLGIPVRLQNDANAGAVAEWKFGAGRGVRNMVFLTFGTGLGAGLILDGRLYSGIGDSAGECGQYPARTVRAGRFRQGRLVRRFLLRRRHCAARGCAGA